MASWRRKAHDAERLAEGLSKAGKSLTEDDVSSVLQSLAEIELNSGQVMKLATKDANEHWKALKI